MHKANNWILTSLALLMVLAVILILREAGDYYLTQQLERPYMEEHRVWRPAGSWGHGLGIAGSVMIILMLSYTLRKRVRRMHNLGHLRTWLNYHIFLGISGPILILFHTTFKFHGIVAVSFWSMAAVALSGFIGRYIYVQIPRARNGAELSVYEIEGKNQDLTRQMISHSRLSEPEMKTLLDSVSPRSLKSTWLTLLILPFQRISILVAVQREVNSISRRHELPKADSQKLKQLVRKKAVLQHRISVLDELHKIFHLWHVIHKPFAYVMIFIMVIHSTVTIYMGFRWIF